MVPPKGRMALANLSSVIFKAMITTVEHHSQPDAPHNLR